jgi:L-arabinonolactonase
MAKLTEFSTHKCSLGEGIIWSPRLQCLFWLDITEKCIFQKHISSLNTNFDRRWIVDFIPSALVLLENENEILVVSDVGLLRLDLQQGSFNRLVEFNLLDCYRTNDAGVGPNNTLWVGIMEKEPSGLNGSILVIFPDGYTTKLALPIGIPNTFVLKNSSSFMYISDSFLGLMYSIEVLIEGYDISYKLKEFFSTNSTIVTPDGGCISHEDLLLTSLWDGECIGVYDKNGNQVSDFPLPVLRPTNCCIGGDGCKTLYITSARLGLSNDQLSKYPLSGSTLSFELDRKISMSEPLRWEPEC